MIFYSQAVLDVFSGKYLYGIDKLCLGSIGAEAGSQK